MNRGELIWALLSVFFVPLSHAQEPTQRRTLIELIRENPPPLPESCLSPSFGPITVEFLEDFWFLSGCDEELTYMVLSPDEDLSSRTSFRFALIEGRYSLVAPGPIEGRATAIYSDIGKLSRDQLSQFARKLRESELQ